MKNRLLNALLNTEKGLKVISFVAEKEMTKMKELNLKTLATVDEKESRKIASKVCMRLRGLENNPLVLLNSKCKEKWDIDNPAVEMYYFRLFTMSEILESVNKTLCKEFAKEILNKHFLEKALNYIPAEGLRLLGRLYVSTIELSRKENLTNMLEEDKKKIVFTSADNYYSNLFSTICTLSIFYKEDEEKIKKIKSLTEGIAESSLKMKANILHSPEASKTFCNLLFVDNNILKELSKILKINGNAQFLLLNTGVNNYTLITEFLSNKNPIVAGNLLYAFQKTNIPIEKKEIPIKIKEKLMLLEGKEDKKTLDELIAIADSVIEISKQREEFDKILLEKRKEEIGNKSETDLSFVGYIEDKFIEDNFNNGFSQKRKFHYNLGGGGI